jgi:hypothetical protein
MARWLDRVKQTRDEERNETPDRTDRYARVLPTLDAALAWRVDAMRAQIPPRGPIPFLVARLDLATPHTPDHCRSCGDPLDEGRRYRCAPCQEAAWLALNEVREGVPV